MIHLFGLIENEWVYLCSVRRGLAEWRRTCLETFLNTQVETIGW